jgi:hypothetical protein
VVVVAGEDEIDAVVVEDRPQGRECGVPATDSGGDVRPVDHRDHVLVGVSGEVSLEPRCLRRSGVAPDAGVSALRVQDDDVPLRSDVVAVEAGAARPGWATIDSNAIEVIEITVAVVRAVPEVVVARCGASP